MPAKRHFYGVMLAGQWWPAYSGIWIFPPLINKKSKNKKNRQSWTPSDKTFWIRACTQKIRWRPESVLRSPFWSPESLLNEDAAYHFSCFSFQFSACKRKLDSKCEALLILSQELDQCRSERDQFKLMAEQLRERYQSLKKQLSGQVSCFVLFDLILNVPSTIFQLNRDGSSWVEPVLS